MRVYEPVTDSDDPTADLSGVLYYHGGGWVVGSHGMSTFCGVKSLVFTAQRCA